MWGMGLRGALIAIGLPLGLWLWAEHDPASAAGIVAWVQAILPAPM